MRLTVFYGGKIRYVSQITVLWKLLVGWRITEVLEYECETLETFEMRLVRQITALSYGAKCTNFDNR